MNKQVEYFDDTHEYLVDGVKVPSVSKLVAYVLKTEVSNIPKDVLQKASDFGTRVHTIVENFFDIDTPALEMNDEEEEIFDKWFDLTLEKDIKLINSEQIVFTDDYAGRYDLLATVGGVKTLIDIKTNRVYPKEHLEIQMGLYLKAYGEQLPCACCWYDKTNCEWHYIEVSPISIEKCDEIIYAFKNDLEPPREAKEELSIDVYTPQEIEKIRSFYALKKEIDAIEENAKQKMKEYMRENDIKTLENDDFKITYTPRHTKEDVDRDKLKKDNLYDTYKKEVEVSDSIRITNKWLKAKEPKH